MFEKYSAFIKKNSFNLNQKSLPNELLIEEDGDLAIYYAPFDYVNRTAKVIICGITPGFQQSILALREARIHLRKGSSISKILSAAKNTASFSGPMRTNLVKMLNFIGLPEKIGISTSSELFGNRTDLVHYTSALRYPVFRAMKNYNGTPSMISNDMLRRQLEINLYSELSLFDKRVLCIPLGPKVAEALIFAAKEGIIDQSQVLDGLPHPSGANSERIAYFLNKKDSKSLSKRTNAKKINESRQKILNQLEFFSIEET